MLVLGDDEKLDMLVPTLVRGELQNKTVMQVAAGDEHSTHVDGVVIEICTRVAIDTQLAHIKHTVRMGKQRYEPIGCR